MTCFRNGESSNPGMQLICENVWFGWWCLMHLVGSVLHSKNFAILAPFGITSYFAVLKSNASCISFYFRCVRWFGVFYEKIYLILTKFHISKSKDCSLVMSQQYHHRAWIVVNRQRTFPINFILMKQIKIHHSPFDYFRYFLWNGGIKMKTRLSLTKLCII